MGRRVSRQCLQILNQLRNLLVGPDGCQPRAVSSRETLRVVTDQDRDRGSGRQFAYVPAAAETSDTISSIYCAGVLPGPPFREESGIDHHAAIGRIDEWKQ